jgi:cytochrome c-type biogenesis protein
MTEILENLSKLITGNAWLAPVVALLAGIITSFTPCSLSSIPLVIGYVGGTGQREIKRVLLAFCYFCCGSCRDIHCAGSYRFYCR